MGISSNTEYEKLITGTFTAVNQTLDIISSNSGTVTLQLTGTWVGTIVFEVSNDANTWIAQNLINPIDGSNSTTTSANGVFILNTNGFANARLVASAFISGTATASVFGSDASGVNFSVHSSSITGTPVTPSAMHMGGRDPDGNLKSLAVDADGRLVTSALTGFGANFTFGDVTTTATTRTLVRRTAYTEQTTNGQRSIASASANDSAAGTGARTIQIVYLDATGAGPFTEILTLNGTTGVNTVATNICFIEQIDVLTVGSTGSNVGIITLYTAINKGGSAIGTISATNNQTFWAHHYVATGKTCNVTGISCGHSGTTTGSGALFTINAKSLSNSVAAETQASDFVRLYGQSSTFSRVYTSPIKVLGPARLQVYVTPETASSTTYRAAFDFFEP